MRNVTRNMTVWLTDSISGLSYKRDLSKKLTAVNVPSEATLFCSEEFFWNFWKSSCDIQKSIDNSSPSLSIFFPSRSLGIYSLHIQQVFVFQHAMTIGIMASIKEQIFLLQIIQERNLLFQCRVFFHSQSSFHYMFSAFFFLLLLSYNVCSKTWF